MSDADDRTDESSEEPSKDDWQADWDGHRKWQLTAALGSTPAQRLAWLEEVLDLMQKIARSSSGC
jgi:hypothetical protein